MALKPEPKKSTAPAKSRGRKKLELSADALKKLKQIEENAKREKLMLIVAERSKVALAQLQQTIDKLQAIVKNEGQFKLSSGEIGYIRNISIKVDALDAKGKRVKVDLENVHNR